MKELIIDLEKEIKQCSSEIKEWREKWTEGINYDFFSDDDKNQPLLWWFIQRTDMSYEYQFLTLAEVEYKGDNCLLFDEQLVHPYNEFFPKLCRDYNNKYIAYINELHFKELEEYKKDFEKEHPNQSIPKDHNFYSDSFGDYAVHKDIMKIPPIFEFRRGRLEFLLKKKNDK